MMKILRSGFALCAMALSLLLPGPAAAQSPPPAAKPAEQATPAPKTDAAAPTPKADSKEASPNAPDAEAVASGPERAIERAKSRIQELEGRTDVAPAVREEALTLLRTALGHAEAAAASAVTATRFQQSSQRAPDRIAEAKQQLEALQNSTADNEFASRASSLNLSEAQQALDAANSEAATLKTELDQFENRLRDMSGRATAAREEQTAEKQAIDALENPEAAPHTDLDPVVAEARRTAIAAERRARTAKLHMLEQEIITLPARQASTTARRDLAAAKLEKLNKRIPIVEQRVSALREIETAKKDREAAQEARKLSAQHPVLEAYVKDTEVIKAREADMARLVDENKAKLLEVQAELARVRDSRTAAQQVLEIGSIGGEFSELLRAMRAQLPSVARLQRRIIDRDQTIVDARLRRLRSEEARRALQDAGGMADRVLAGAAKEGETIPADVRPALEKLVLARRDLYVQLYDSLVTRISQLAELNATERDLLNQTNQLQSLLNSRLLWLPTAEPIGTGWFKQVQSSFVWLGNLEDWKATGRLLVERALERPILTGLVLLIFGGLLLFSRRLFARLGAIENALGRYKTDNYLRTPEALLISALLALRSPILFVYAGWLLSELPQVSEFSAGVGAGLLTVASLVTFLRFVQFVCIEKGLFSAHFGWSERARNLLWRNSLWLKYVLIPVGFVLGMISVSSAQYLRDGLGRFAFLAGGIAVAIFVWRVLHPRHGIFAERLVPGTAIWMTRYLWHAFLTLVPLAVAGLALWGYYDGASQIQAGLIYTVAIIFGAFLAYSIVMRQVLVTRRRLEVRRALERREKAREQLAAQEALEYTGEGKTIPIEEPEVDIASISEQTRNLVRLAALLLLAAALYFFWREALPSLALLDVPLWQQTVTVDGAARNVPVTVSNVMIALAVLAITFIATRNLPGLLEITALHRLRIEAGTRYAVGAVSRYLIAIVGIAFAFRSIGFDWSQVQWIVAALGVGVGFGLQEIVANFISGLIILFERPVRVGDTVTIGNLTGTVSRIHIRATSMTDGENREIIIPNKALITEKVINWTLTDSITRVTLKITVRYGTDTLRAQMAILDAVKATPQVLDSPAPSVFFIGFGPSALEFEVRAFVLQLAHRSAVINDLHVAIERALREQEIAMT
ncbi:mechanosensitive ion channel domain-containing protein [Hyphomicrobium sp. CS1GBMeth3]|uniref:mechanosensitive ion channel domain-containing protein n=1 Tax=Hyphomicrobium sp. CS1GBMeth3 TaxID=1892845 RepID=UPI0009FB2A5E|nr:mechanosensitive ion channel domain-containing protein [Hyphomicrobium sp. CS1GBMeth3]